MINSKNSFSDLADCKLNVPAMYHLTGLMVHRGFCGAEGIGVLGGGLLGVCGWGDSECTHCSADVLGFDREVGNVYGECKGMCGN